MNETKAQIDSINLSQMIVMPGWRLFVEEATERQKRGWEDFIALPVDQKTSKAAFHHQAQYDAIKGLLEWVKGTIEEGL